MKSKYDVNELIVHRREGLASIDSIVVIGDKEYFLVRTKKESGETFYVPIERADDIIRKVMNEKEADFLINFMKTVPNDYIANTKQRRDGYKKRLSSGDILDYAYLTCQLYYHERINDDNVMHLGQVDIDILSRAKGILYDELSITYKKSRDEIEKFIKTKL